MVIAADGTTQYNAPELWAAAKAFAAEQNAQGGIKGHPIQVLACNDKNQPNEATKCARQAISEKVAAMVGGSAH